MLALLKHFSQKVYLFIRRFELLITALFVFGILELVAFSDVFVTLFAIPEAAPIVLIIVAALGIYRFIKFKYSKKKKSDQSAD
jgi:hypothetical protein